MFHIFKKITKVNILSGVSIALLLTLAVVSSMYHKAQNEVNSGTKSISILESKIESKSKIQLKLESELAFEKEVNIGLEEKIKEYKASVEESNLKVKELNGSIEKLKKELAEKRAELNKKISSAEKKGVPISRGTSYTGKNNNATSDSSFKTFEATAYTAYCTGCSGVTRAGIDLRANPSLKVIAVDPNVIKLGSLVEIQSDSYPSVNGTYVAGDTGGAIKGNKIDIFIPTKGKAYEFGRRDIKAKVIRNGW